MASDQLVTAKAILAAQLEFERLGSLKIIQDMERREPDLSEYLLEHSTQIFHDLGEAGVSAKHQGSTEDQLRACVIYAASHGIYVAPEFICVDEAVKGRKARRDGLERINAIIATGMVKVFLVYKLSRLFRQSYKSIQFFREELVDQDRRGISVSENIDTIDKKSWRLQVSIRGAMDEEVVEAIGDHVREGHIGIFKKGWALGAMPVEFTTKELLGVPKTRRELPRMVIAVDEAAALLIRKHFDLIANGMAIRVGWQLWVAEGGPVDKRSGKSTMGYYAYRRMLTRISYTGRFRFGRKRNEWSAKRDGVWQILQPEDQITVVDFPELRIVSDDVFFKVQQRIEAMKQGPRPRSNKKEHHLWDLVIGIFNCPHCHSKFHMVGAKGQYMHCPIPHCPAHAMLHRQRTVSTVCQKLSSLLVQDASLIDQIVSILPGLAETDTPEREQIILSKEQEIRRMSARIMDLEELLGAGSDDERQRRKQQILTANNQRSTLRMELTILKNRKSAERTAL